MKVELVLRQREADCQWPEGKEMYDISKLKRHYLEAKKEKKEEERM